MWPKDSEEAFIPGDTYITKFTAKAARLAV